MSFASTIKVPKKLISLFGAVPLDKDVTEVFLSKTTELPDKYICYNVFVKGKTGSQKAGQVSLTKRFFSFFVQSSDQRVKQVKGMFWDRRIEMCSPNDSRPSFGKIGITRAALYRFMEESEKQGISHISVMVQDTNIASLKLSQKCGIQGVRCFEKKNPADEDTLLQPTNLLFACIGTKQTLENMRQIAEMEKAALCVSIKSKQQIACTS